MPEANASKRRSLVRGARVATLLGVVAALATGQVWGAIQYNAKLKTERSKVVTTLREDKGIPPDQSELFDDYIVNYALAQFILPDNLNKLPKVRKDFRTYFQPGGAGPAHQRLNELVLKNVTELLRGPQPPVVRYNLVLILGELNEQEGSGQSKGKPLAEVLPILLKLFTANPNGAKVGAVDALRFAALLGIQRHAENPNTAPEQRAVVREAMLAVVRQKAPPPGRDQAVHDFLRQRSAETLVAMQDVGAKGSVVKAFDTVLNDPTESARLRGKMAVLLGQFRYPGDASIDFKAVADHMGRFAADAVKQEVDTAKAKKAPLSLRRSKTWVKEALEGLGGESGKAGILAAASDEPVQKYIETITKKLKVLDKTLDDGNSDPQPRMLAQNVGERVKDLEGVLQPRAAGPKQPDKNPVAPKVEAPKPNKDPKALAGQQAQGPRRMTAPVRGSRKVDAVNAEVIDADAPKAGNQQ